MTSIDIDERLAAVAALVPDGARVADIGCDHAMLPIALVLSGVIERAIGIDRASAPLERARANVRAAAAPVELRLGDGLAPLVAGEVDCVTMAGVGGEAAVRALPIPQLLRLGIERVVIQPNKKIEMVRRAFFDAGWACTMESVVWRKGRPFVTALFESPRPTGGSGIAYDVVDLVVGPHLRHASGAAVDAYIGHLRRWCEDVERAAGRRQSSISADISASVLRELEAERRNAGSK